MCAIIHVTALDVYWQSLVFLMGVPGRARGGEGQGGTMKEADGTSKGLLFF